MLWFTKRQNTVESSTFSSEFIAMKICVEHIIALRFKLRMFGVLVGTWPELVYSLSNLGDVDSNVVRRNTTLCVGSEN